MFDVDVIILKYHTLIFQIFYRICKMSFRLCAVKIIYSSIYLDIYLSKRSIFYAFSLQSALEQVLRHARRV